MKKTLLLLLLLSNCFSSIAQIAYEPKILILSPTIVAYDPSFQHEIDTTNNSLKKMVLLNQKVLSDQKKQV